MDKVNMLGEREALLEEIRSLEAQNGELRTMLRNLEWTPWNGTKDPVWCRACHGTILDGHSPDCALARSIK